MQMVTMEEQLAAALAEIASLRNEIASKDELLSSNAKELAASREKISSQDLRINELNRQLEWLRRKVFGRMSEKKHLPLHPEALQLQLSLFPDEMTDEEKAALKKDVEESEQKMTKTITVTRKKPARKPLDTTSLPVREHHIYPEGTTDENGSLKAGYVEMGTEVSERLEIIPSSMFVDRTVRHKVIPASQMREEPKNRTIMIAPLPVAPISKGIAGASLLADIIIGKFMYHMPFYRLIYRYKESGVSISSSTMNGWYEASVESLHHLYKLLRQQVMRSEYIQVDESVVPVMDDERRKTRKGYEWCVRDGITGQLFFWYDLGSRSNKTAMTLLGGYRGVLQCDGYEAYDQFEEVNGITLVACWAHVRRKFTESQKEDNRLASEALVYIKKIYSVESEADEAGDTPEERSKRRKEEAYPVLLTFEKWLLDNYYKVTPKSSIGKAISYAYALMDRLSYYVNDGRINIDSNLIENAIRPLAIGRKNWLFCGNDASAYRAAIVYSMIASCKAAGIEPREWMEDVLVRIPEYLANKKDLNELLPVNWSSHRKA